MARHNTQNGQKCGDNQSPFKSTVHKGNNFPCCTTITQIVCRRISVPRALLSQKWGGEVGPGKMRLISGTAAFRWASGPLEPPVVG